MKFICPLSFYLPDTTSFTWTPPPVAASSSDSTVFSSERVRGYEDQTALQENSGDDRSSVRAGRLIYGCGAFFALKIQTAKSTKQMEEFAKEVVNLEKLRGHSNIVQIRDHTLRPRSGHVVILMELAACDLDIFFKRSGYSFGVPGMFSIWRSLVNAVGAAHTEDIIHRDLKPQNFLLVPIAPPFADKILATTAVPADNFEFRIVKRVTTNDPEKVGDVELILRDSATGVVQLLQLIIKVSDFGLARPLDLDADGNVSHLSIQGHAGTIKYMAPEAFQASEDDVQRLTKRVDIWALGVILFQMLHGGRTPFDRYCSPGNNIRAAVAIASRDIHAKVMKFERQSVWATERNSLQRHLRTLRSTGSEGDTTTNASRQSVTTAKSLLSTEFLFRICENCLAFEAPDRVLAGDLKIWLAHLLDSEWWEQTIRSLSDAAVQALFAGVSVSMEDDEVETASQLDNLNLVKQGGDRIEQVFFRELRRAASPLRRADVNTNFVALPATGEGVEEREQRNDAEQLHVVVLPAGAGGEAVVEREQADDGTQLGVVVLPAGEKAVEEREQAQADDHGIQLEAVPLPGTGEAVEKCEQGDDGEQSQGCLFSARWESVEKREEDDRGLHLQVVAFPTTEARGEREEGDDKEQLQAAQELLPRCINEEDCGRQGAECASEHPTRPRPRRRRFASPQCSCDFNIMGIIGVTFIVLAMAVGLFVVFKLIPESTPHEPAVSIPVPPTAPTFLAPTIPLPSPTAPVLVGPPIAPPAAPKVIAPPQQPPAAPEVIAPTNLPGAPSPSLACPDSAPAAPKVIAPTNPQGASSPVGGPTANSAGDPVDEFRPEESDGTGHTPPTAPGSPTPSGPNPRLRLSPARQEPPPSPVSPAPNANGNAALAAAGHSPSSGLTPMTDADLAMWNIMIVRKRQNTFIRIPSGPEIAILSPTGVVLFDADCDGLVLTSKDFVLKLLKAFMFDHDYDVGWILKCVSPNLKEDKDVVLAAVLRYGLALEFASEALRADREVVLAAVGEDGMALVFARLAAPYGEADTQIVRVALPNVHRRSGRRVEARWVLWSVFVPLELRRRLNDSCMSKSFFNFFDDNYVSLNDTYQYLLHIVSSEGSRSDEFRKFVASTKFRRNSISRAADEIQFPTRNSDEIQFGSRSDEIQFPSVSSSGVSSSCSLSSHAPIQ